MAPQVGDLTEVPDGLCVVIRCSKTDQEGELLAEIAQRDLARGAATHLLEAEPKASRAPNGGGED